MQRRRKTDRERRRGGAVCNKWKFHFPASPFVSTAGLSQWSDHFLSQGCFSYTSAETEPPACNGTPEALCETFSPKSLQVWVMEKFHLPTLSNINGFNYFFFHYGNYWRDPKGTKTWPCSWPWIKNGIPQRRPPMWTKSSPPRACERCLGLAQIPHLTHLQLEGPPFSLHVLPSVWSLCPDQTQLPSLLLSLLLLLPSDGGEGRKKKKTEYKSVILWSFLYAVYSSQIFYSLSL